MMSDTAKNDSRRYLTLTLGKESFAISIDVVREILDYTEITRIPQSPPFMQGRLIELLETARLAYGFGPGHYPAVWGDGKRHPRHPGPALGLGLDRIHQAVAYDTAQLRQILPHACALTVVMA